MHLNQGPSDLESDVKEVAQHVSLFAVLLPTSI
jgi:hypothetical protein